MKNEWLNIDGEQVLWDEFMYALDDYRFRIKRKYGSQIHERYCCMIFAIQEMADIYHNRPEHWPSEYVLGDMKKQGYPALKNEQLPEAIEEAYDQMKRILGIDLDEMLSKCVEKSKTAYQKKLEKEEKENGRLEKSRLLAGKIREQGTQSEMDYLVELQKAKEADPDYEVTETEWQVTVLLCQIIASRFFTQYVPYDVLDKAYDLDLINDSEVESLLEENGYEFDYKCYRTTFEGDNLYQSTIIPFDEFCQACKPNAEKVLGCAINL